MVKFGSVGSFIATVLSVVWIALALSIESTTRQDNYDTSVQAHDRHSAEGQEAFNECRGNGGSNADCAYLKTNVPNPSPPSQDTAAMQVDTQSLCACTPVPLSPSLTYHPPPTLPPTLPPIGLHRSVRACILHVPLRLHRHHQYVLGSGETQR